MQSNRYSSALRGALLPLLGAKTITRVQSQGNLAQDVVGLIRRKESIPRRPVRTW